MKKDKLKEKTAMILLNETQKSFYNLFGSLSIEALEDLKNVIAESNFVERKSRENICLTLSKAIRLKQNYSNRLPFTA